MRPDAAPGVAMAIPPPDPSLELDVRVPSDLLPETPDRSSEPLYRLPVGILALGWLLATLMAIGGWPLVGLAVEMPAGWLRWGMTGAAISAGVGGLGLLILGPWKPRRSGDLPTLWLASTTARLLAIPAVAFLIYSAARPPDRPFVIGLAISALLLLLIEVPIIARSMLAQIEAEEARRPRDDG